MPPPHPARGRSPGRRLRDAWRRPQLHPVQLVPRPQVHLVVEPARARPPPGPRWSLSQARPSASYADRPSSSSSSASAEVGQRLEAPDGRAVEPRPVRRGRRRARGTARRRPPRTASTGCGHEAMSDSRPASSAAGEHPGPHVRPVARGDAQPGAVAAAVAPGARVVDALGHLRQPAQRALVGDREVVRERLQPDRGVAHAHRRSPRLTRSSPRRARRRGRRRYSGVSASDGAPPSDRPAASRTSAGADG